MTNLCSLYKAYILAWVLAALVGAHIVFHFYTEGFSGDLIMDGGMLAVISMIARYLTKLKSYLRLMEQRLTLWSKGNFEERFVMITEPEGAGQMGEVLWKLNEFADAVDSFVRESTASMLAVAEEKYFRKIIIVGMMGAFKKGAISINEGVESAHKKGEILVHAVDELEKNVTAILEDVKTASDTVNKFCNELVSLSQDSLAKTETVSKDSLQAQNNVDSVAISSNELSSSISEISRKVIESNSVVYEAMQKTEDTSAKMQNLKKLSQEVNNITSMISDIAEQTNLLALNATIESARAGEAGKGFAVVASEVKNLAVQTVGATSEISSRLNSMQESVDGLVVAIQDVAGTISRVSEISTIISAAVKEQSASTREISNNMVQAASNTKRVTVNLSDVSNIVSSIHSFSETVNDAAGKLSERIITLGNGLNDFKKTINS
jgi:methyl-accepting chemotaxis protein